MRILDRRNQILSAILAVQIVLAVVLLWPRATGSTTDADKLLGDNDSSDVTALTITDPDGTQLALAKESGQWLLPRADGYPVTATKINDALDSLTAVSRASLVTKTASSHTQLQVGADDFARKIDMVIGDETRTLYLGSSPSYGATHVRLQGESETYLAKDLSAWDITAQVTTWIDTSYVNLDTATVTRIAISNTNGDLVLARPSADQPWIVEDIEPAEGQQLSTVTIDSLVRAVGTLHMAEPLGKSDNSGYGLGSPLASVVVEHGDGAVTILVGAQDPVDQTYVIKATSSNYYVRASSYSVQSLVDASAESMVEDIPQPETETTS